MINKPSKELFCEVLDLLIENDTYLILVGDNLILKKDICNVFTINIFEFVFKVKDWIYSKDFTIQSFKAISICTIVFNSTKRESFTDDIELNTIISAGEWILKDKK